MWKAPFRPREERITQDFNDGLVTICTVTDAARPGYQPRPEPAPKLTLRYQERRLGIQRVLAEHGGQRLPRGQREASVVFLVRPREPQFQGCVGRAGPDQRSLVRTRGCFNGLRSLRELKGGAYGSRRTDGSGLVCGDGREASAKHVLVVHCYGGIAESVGAGGGGGVVAAAKPSLKNGHIHPLFRKGQQGEHGKELKIRQFRGCIHDFVGLRGP